MRLGVGFFTCQRPAVDRREFSELYADLLSHARLSEAVGLDSIWLAEHHFSADGYLSAVLPVCGALAAVTSRITIGCEVATSFYHPLRLAEDAIMIDQLSRGRFILGLARSYRPLEFAALDVDPRGEDGRLEAAVGVLREAFEGHSVNTHGGQQLTLVPPFRQGGPPLLMGFHGRPEVEAERAARLGDLFRTDPSLSLEEVVRLIEIFDGHRGDRPTAEVIVFCYGFISAGDAWAEMASGFAHLRATYDLWADRQPADLLRKEDHRLVLGTPEQVLAQLLEYRRRFGDRLHVVLRLEYPGMSRASVAAAIEDYGAVAQQLRAA